MHAESSRWSLFHFFSPHEAATTIAIVISILISLYNKKVTLFSLTTYFYITTALSLYKLESPVLFHERDI